MVYNVTQWLDKTAEKYPDKIAFSDQGGQITFGELREKALTLAERLIETEVYKKPVAVMMKKSVDAVAAFMGIAYSGNFYTVFDMEMPASRIKKIWEVLQPEAIATTLKDKAAGKMEGTRGVVICMEELPERASCKEAVLKRRDAACDTDLLYVLFTSGSTGIPKGVTICHRSVIHYIEWVSEAFQITEKDTFGNQSPFYFDNSVLDIYTALKTGASVDIIPSALFSQPSRLLGYIRDKDINTIFWVPSVLVMTANLHALKKVNLSGTVCRVLFAGEVMPAKQLNEWRKALPNAVFANLYGPTEITVDCTCYIVDREFADDEAVPIGHPICNISILVLNEKNKAVEIGETGELCVRGSSLSLGYYNNPEKTKEAFVQNPLNSSYAESIYRTGDLVKYNEYGELMFISRKDYQVKHMGYRIELGEVEAAAYGIAGVGMCCCIYDAVKKRICLAVEGTVGKETVLEELKKALPSYMVPGKIMILDKMPLNANGKIDRKRLEKII